MPEGGLILLRIITRTISISKDSGDGMLDHNQRLFLI